MSILPGESMSNIDYDKLRKLAEQHPEIADRVTALLKEGSSSKVYDALVDLTTYLKMYVKAISDLEPPLDLASFTGPHLDFQTFTDEMLSAVKRLDRATGELLESDDDEILRASDRIYKKFYKPTQRLASGKEAGADSTTLEAFTDFVDQVVALRHSIEAAGMASAEQGDEAETLKMELAMVAESVQAQARILYRRLAGLLDSDDTAKVTSTLLRMHKAGFRLRKASEDGSAPYPNKIDHGYNQPLSGGWDIMKRLQDQLLIEQGRPTREPNPRLAGGCGGSCGTCSCGTKSVPNGGEAPRLAEDLQKNLIRVLQGGSAREMVRQAVIKHADASDTVVMVNAAVEEILDRAVAVALSPDHMASVLDKHTIKES